ncbi:MAG: hypothetical protein WDW36_002602 [Sanguina aurantia]
MREWEEHQQPVPDAPVNATAPAPQPLPSLEPASTLQSQQAALDEAAALEMEMFAAADIAPPEDEETHTHAPATRTPAAMLHHLTDASAPSHATEQQHQQQQPGAKNGTSSQRAAERPAQDQDGVGRATDGRTEAAQHLHPRLRSEIRGGISWQSFSEHNHPQQQPPESTSSRGRGLADAGPLPSVRDRSELPSRDTLHAGRDAPSRDRHDTSRGDHPSSRDLDVRDSRENDRERGRDAREPYDSRNGYDRRPPAGDPGSSRDAGQRYDARDRSGDSRRGLDDARGSLHDRHSRHERERRSPTHRRRVSRSKSRSKSPRMTSAPAENGHRAAAGRAAAAGERGAAEAPRHASHESRIQSEQAAAVAASARRPGAGAASSLLRAAFKGVLQASAAPAAVTADPEGAPARTVVRLLSAVGLNGSSVRSEVVSPGAEKGGTLRPAGEPASQAQQQQQQRGSVFDRLRNGQQQAQEPAARRSVFQRLQGLAGSAGPALQTARTPATDTRAPHSPTAAATATAQHPAQPSPPSEQPATRPRAAAPPATLDHTTAAAAQGAGGLHHTAPTTAAPDAPSPAATAAVQTPTQTSTKLNPSAEAFAPKRPAPGGPTAAAANKKPRPAPTSKSQAAKAELAQMRAELARVAAEVAALRGEGAPSGAATAASPAAATAPVRASPAAAAAAAAQPGGVRSSSLGLGTRQAVVNGLAMPSVSPPAASAVAAGAGLDGGSSHATQAQQALERDARSVAVQNLHPMVDEGMLAAHFRACGDVVGVIPDIDLFSGALTGVVIVEFAHKICAIQALRMEGSLLLSCPVRVSLKTALMAQIRSSQQQGLSFGAASMAMPGVPSQQNGVRQQAQEML